MTAALQLYLRASKCVRISDWLSYDYDNPRTRGTASVPFSEFSETQWCERKNRANVLCQASRTKQILGKNINLRKHKLDYHLMLPLWYFARSQSEGQYNPEENKTWESGMEVWLLSVNLHTEELKETNRTRKKISFNFTSNTFLNQKEARTEEVLRCH